MEGGPGLGQAQGAVLFLTYVVVAQVTSLSGILLSCVFMIYTLSHVLSYSTDKFSLRKNNHQTLLDLPKPPIFLLHQTFFFS